MRSRAVLVAASLLACLAAGWWFLVPATLGGRATYVVTHGVSMEPGFHTGDLAVVYPASDYRVGEVAAYRSRLLHTIVLHRIIGRDGARFVFRGDNNSWLDPEHPTKAQLVGRLVMHLPRGGTLLGWLHNPYLTGLLALGVAFAGAAGTTTRRRRRRARAENRPMNLHLSHLSWTGPAVAAGVGALAFAGLAAASFVAPARTQTSTQVPWSEQVVYGYSAATTPSVVYPDGRVRAGQTVFRKLIHQLQVRTTWTLHAQAAHHTTGTATLQAVMADTAGWTHRLTLAGPTAFTGNRVSLTGTLELPVLDQIAHRAAQLTGVPTDSYTVTVCPLVRLHGSLAGQPLNLTDSPALTPLTLQVTAATVTPTSPASTTQPASPQPGGRPLPRSLTSHTITVTRPAPAAWPLLGHPIPLAKVRLIAGAGTATLLAACLLLLVRRPGSERCRCCTTRHRRSIVPVQHLTVADTRTIVDVSSLDALARIAQRYDRLILEQTTQPGTYHVEDDTALYRYQCHAPHQRPAGRRRAAPNAAASA